MHGATHLTTGLAAGFVIGVSMGETDPLTLAVCTGLGGIGGLIPDWLQINIPGASKQLKGTFGHRGFSHWVWTALICAFALDSFLGSPRIVSKAFLGGWVCHILLDALAGGVPAFWPFGQLRIARIKTESDMDKAFGGAGIVLLAVTFIKFIL